MNKVELNDLPKWSQWPARLLGLTPFAVPSRTIEKIDQEYDKDKYAQCLDYCRRMDGNITHHDVRQFEYRFSLTSDPQICISYGNDLYAVSQQEAVDKYDQLLLEKMGGRVEKCKTVVELGTGYGYNLWMLQQQFGGATYLGGDYSHNAVEAASNLSARTRERDQIKVHQFNFYDQQTYGFLETAEPPVLLFTSFAIEQCPSAKLILDALELYREKIEAVFHFEPVYELHDETLLGLMRRRYVELNDYNRDLLSELKRRSGIRLLDAQADVYGLNPFNPTSIIEWEFAR